ncbi:hypothetical protein A9Q99_06530 [Gammaproteobacteria bacterium 45_16_T64]|nr:hypothetical protein A9Q99_06530 [Gammaproteobacteria bacterium 45_16_T64]
MAEFFHRRHVPVNILCPIRPEKIGALADYLEDLNNRIREKSHPLFQQINTHHFCRWTVLPASKGERGEYPAQLLFESNIDENLSSYVERLIKKDKQTLLDIYQHCERFDASQCESYLLDHSISTPMYYRGAHYHSCKQIKRDQILYKVLEGFIDEKQDSGSLIDYFDSGLREQLIRHVKNSNISWPFDTLQRQPDPYWPMAIGIIPVLLLLSPILLPLIAVWFYFLRKHEKSELPEVHDNNMTERHAHVASVTKDEQQAVQSPMTSVVEIKPGLFRLLTLKAVLWLLNLLSNIFYNRGELGSINSIHFARWIITDDNKRLVFLSNYDGSWENYLGDFIDRAAVGLTAVWSNAEGFPRATRLIREGATDDIRFKAYARKSQTKTACWYSAYPELSLQNVINNSKIRQGLTNNMDEKELSLWLSRF